MKFLDSGFRRNDGNIHFQTFYETITEHDRQFYQIKFRLTEHDRQFSAILEKQEEHDEKFKDVLAHFDELYHRFTRLEDEYHAIVQGLCRSETLMETEQGKREILDRRLEELKSQVADLQLRIVELEERFRD